VATRFNSYRASIRVPAKQSEARDTTIMAYLGRVPLDAHFILVVSSNIKQGQIDARERCERRVHLLINCELHLPPNRSGISLDRIRLDCISTPYRTRATNLCAKRNGDETTEPWRRLRRQLHAVWICNGAFDATRRYVSKFPVAILYNAFCTIITSINSSVWRSI